MLVSLSKTIQNKLYQTAELQIKPDESGKFYLVSSRGSFLKVSESISFQPNAKRYVYFPETLIRPNTLGDLSPGKDRLAAYHAVDAAEKAHSYQKVMKLGELTKEQLTDHSPILVDLWPYFQKVEPYADEAKRSPQQRYAYYRVVLGKILGGFRAETKSKSAVVVISHDPTSAKIDPLLFTLMYGLKKDFEGCASAFADVRVVVTDPVNKIFCEINLSDKRKAVQSVNALTGLVRASAKAAGSAAAPEVDVEAEGEAAKPASSEQDDAVGDEVRAPDPADVASVDRVTDVDLNELLATDTSSEFDRLERENREFIAKFKDAQDKAVGGSEKTEGDFQLEVPTAADDAVINETVKSTKAAAITTSYYRKMFRKDVAALLKTLNDDPEFPAVVVRHEMKDNSDPLNLKDELSVTFLDKSGRKHNFVVDVPKLSSDGFLYINGNKKFISKQLTLLPLIKEAPDRVQLTTSYSKTFLFRKGDKTNSVVDRIFKTLVGKSYKGVKQTYGNSFSSNIRHNVGIPYNYIARRLFAVDFEVDPATKTRLSVVFSQKKIRAVLEDQGFKIPEGTNPVAYRSVKDRVDAVFVERISDRTIGVYSLAGREAATRYRNFQEFMVTTIQNTKEKAVYDAFEATNAGKAYSYSEIKLAATSVPLGILVSFYKGLIEALNMYGIKHEVTDKRRRPAVGEVAVQFSDATVYIDPEGDTGKELFVNGLYFLNTKDFSIRDAEKRGAVFIEYFGEAIGSRNIAKAYINFESSMIDPITKEILVDMKLPTEFVPLLFEANNMLANYTHKRKNDMSNFRVRDSEVLAVAVYDTLMKSFNEYKRTAKTGVVTPISAPRDAVIKKVQSMQNVEDYSVLSPFLEMELKSKTTFKGPSGLNSNDAYTAEIRSYDPSMIGLFGIFTPVSGEVGVNRSMVLNPKIKNNRGYLQDAEVESMNMDNLYASGELLNAFTASHSDPMRICMATTQGKHITPTKVQHNYLIGTGLDKTLSQLIGNDFAWKAAEDGEVVRIDQKNQLVFVKYKSGQTTAIDISDKPAKNSASGFFIRNRLELADGVKVGSKFKKGQILAANKSFFKKDMDGSHGFAAGRLTKVAMMCLPTTYEDSAPIIETVANEMASDIIVEKQVALKENSKIIKIAAEGQKVNVNDPLIIFEEIGDSEKDALSAIEKATRAAEGDEELEHLGRNVIKSKYTGTITNIKVYYNCDLESESVEPSLKAYVRSYIDRVKTRSSALKGIKEDDLIELPSIERIDSDKILGNEMSGVLIVFYIAHEEKCDIGNKIAFFSACKGIISEVIPDDKAPLPEYRPERPIEAIVSPMSLIARNTPDLPLMGLANKVILELKLQCVEDLFGKK